MDWNKWIGINGLEETAPQTCTVTHTVDLNHAPYNVYGVKYIGPASLAPIAHTWKPVAHALTWAMRSMLGMAP